MFISFVLVTCSCSMTGKLVQDTDRFDYVVLGRIDQTRGPNNVIDDMNLFTFIVDTILKGNIEPVDGSVMKRVNQISDSTVTMEMLPVKLLHFQSNWRYSEIVYKEANSVMVSSENSTTQPIEMGQQIFMFGDQDFKLLNDQADPHLKVRLSVGNRANLILDQREFQKLKNGILRKYRK